MTLITFLGVFVILLVLVYLSLGFRVVKEGYLMQKYFLGKPLSVKKSGLRYILYGIMSYDLVENKVYTMKLTDEEILTQDEIPLKISLAIYYKLINPAKKKTFEDFDEAIVNMIKGMMREELSKKPLENFTNSLKKTLYEFKKACNINVNDMGAEILDIKLIDTKLTKKMVKHIQNKDIEKKVEKAVKQTKKEEKSKEESDFLLD